MNTKIIIIYFQFSFLKFKFLLYFIAILQITIYNYSTLQIIVLPCSFECPVRLIKKNKKMKKTGRYFKRAIFILKLSFCIVK